MYPSQNEITILVLFTSLIFAVLCIFLVCLVYINARNNARRQLEFMRAMDKGQENERMRLAKDLHDGLGPSFNAIKLIIGTLGEPPDNLNNTLSVHNTQLMVDDVMKEIKMLAYNLSPYTISEYGLLAQLHELKSNIIKTHHISVTITVNDEDMHFKNDFELNLYRIMQELTNNTLKYAIARNINITLNNHPNKLEIKYSDDGKGFDLPTVKRGLGLKNIETRSKFYNGLMDIKTAPNKGTEYNFTFEKKYMIK